MAYQKVHDILEVVQTFHHSMREALGRIQQKSDSDAVEWLSNQILRYELHWQAALASYEKHGTEAVLETWLQYVPDEAVRKEIDSVTDDSEMTLEELTNLNIRFRQALIGLYETLATASAAPRVQELFQQLLEQEQAVAAQQSLQSQDSSLATSETQKKKE